MSDFAAIDSRYAWLRAAACLALTTVGSAGMYVVVVGLPAFELDFSISRSGASLPFTMVMVGFGFGGIATGRLVDRYGVVVPLAASAVALAFAYVGAALAGSFALFALMHVLIGWCGCAAVFGPLIADVSKWFTRRRGLAVAICASGNYLAGAVWPRPLYHLIEAVGWRQTYVVMAVATLVLMLPLVLVLRRRPAEGAAPAVTVAGGGSAGSPGALGLTPAGLTALLCLAGFGCCMAMAMPQVHMVPFCAELGFGPARGAEMLSVLLACGIVSRLTFGVVSDRLGGLRTLLVGAGLQCVALLLFLPADTLASLYFVSALFGLFQGGIVPSYAIIVREYFPEAEAGSRIGLVVFATIAGMAFGGWGSGLIYDWTGSYTVAFVHGVGWNLVTLWVVLFLLSRTRAERRRLQAAVA
jgi:MFS family permease